MILNEVDIFGYEPLRATVRRTTQLVLRFGATKRPCEIEHGPDSLHVFFPRDGVETSDVNVTREPRFIDVRRTEKPGVTDTD